MNKLLLILASLGMVLTFSFSHAQTGYKIDIKIDGFTESQAFLAYYYGDKQYIKDTVPVTNGQFSFEGEEGLDGGIYLVVLPPDNQYFEIIVDQDQEFSLQTVQSDLVGNMNVSGSDDNQIFYSDIQFLAKKRKEVDAIRTKIEALPANSPQKKELEEQYAGVNGAVQAYRATLINDHPDRLYTKVIQSMQEPQVPEAPKDENGKALDSLFAYKYYKKHFFDHIDFSDVRLLRTPVMFNKVNQYLEKLTYKIPDSLVVSIDQVVEKARSNDDVFQFFVVNLLNKYANSKVMGMDAVYVHMVEKYYMSGDAWWSDSATVAKMTERALAISPTLINRKAPNFYAPDAQNRTHYLHKVPGSYTVLYFWDIDCGHCKKVTPKLSESFARYKDHDVTLFTVSINGGQEEWGKRLDEYKLSDHKQAIHTHDPYRKSGFDGMYDLRSTPRLFLLDADKKIMAKQISVEQMDEILSRELGLPVPEKSEDDETGDK
ncbi:MAG: DUF5106 domain-containing protein [Bacteroidota bacterium]